MFPDLTPIKRLSALLFCLFVTLMGSTAASAADAKHEALLDGPTYWYYAYLGKLISQEHQNDTTTGLMQEHHGPVRYRVNKRDREDWVAQEYGIKKVAYVMVDWLKSDDFDEITKRGARKKLYLITGHTFDTDTQWIEWYDQNKKYLHFDPLEDQLVGGCAQPRLAK